MGVGGAEEATGELGLGGLRKWGSGQVQGLPWGRCHCPCPWLPRLQVSWALEVGSNG